MKLPTWSARNGGDARSLIASFGGLGLLRVHVARAGRAEMEALGHGAADVEEGPAHGIHGGPEDVLAIGLGPGVGAGHRVERTLELRHHVAGEQLEAPHRLLAIGPFVSAEEQTAESALAVVEQALNALDHRLR